MCGESDVKYRGKVLELIQFGGVSVGRRSFRRKTMALKINKRKLIILNF
jgi:hypothetical protein